MKIQFFAGSLLCCIFASCIVGCSSNDDSIVIAPEADASQFVVLTDVVPDVILEIRYYSTYTFI